VYNTKINKYSIILYLIIKTEQNNVQIIAAAVAVVYLTTGSGARKASRNALEINDIKEVYKLSVTSFFFSVSSVIALVSAVDDNIADKLSPSTCFAESGVVLAELTNC